MINHRKLERGIDHIHAVELKILNLIGALKITGNTQLAIDLKELGERLSAASRLVHEGRDDVALSSDQRAGE